MELRHAAADEGSLTVAAERSPHTAQPSLRRQIRDLEYEVGVPLASLRQAAEHQVFIELPGVDRTLAAVAVLESRTVENNLRSALLWAKADGE
jgi:hypothetical protein